MLPYQRPRKPRARHSGGSDPALPHPPEKVPQPSAGPPPQDSEPEGANGPFARLSLGGLGLLILFLLAALTWYGHRHGHPSETCLGTGECLPRPDRNGAR